MSESADAAAPADRQNPDRSARVDPPRTAVFDLDGTLLAGDSTVAWLRSLLACPSGRCLLALITLPVWLPLVWLPSSRRIGASLLLWVATFGYDKADITYSIEVFTKRFEEGEGRLRWRSDGLNAVQRHLASGDRVVVVTAAPQWLAGCLLAGTSGVRVLGSSLLRRWGGWIIESHCFGPQKCRALQQSGYGNTWDYAYTDSYDDAPLLAAATDSGFLVNPQRGVMARLQTSGQSRISQLRWS